MKIEQLSEQLTRIEQLLMAQQPPPMSFDEARTYLKCSRGFLYKATSQAIIPHSKPTGKKVYFLKSDLDAFLGRNRIKTTDEIRGEVLRA